MKKFRVYGSAFVSVSIEVDAETAEEAKELAEIEFSGLSGYAGNGGTGKLVGTSEPNEWVEASDGEPEWDFVEEVSNG